MEEENPAIGVTSGDDSVTDSENRAQAIRLEYNLLRAQIAETDKTCVVMLGVLISGSLTLASFAAERSSQNIACLLSPLWLVGYMYLAEKRFIILRTAYYIRSELEPRHAGLGWELWHQRLAERNFLRRDPFYLESSMATLVMVSTPVFVGVLSKWAVLDPAFLLSTLLSLAFLLTLPKAVRSYKFCCEFGKPKVEQG